MKKGFLMKIKPVFAWYDFWVGLFWDSRKRRLYIFPLPTLGFQVDFKFTKRYADLDRCPRCGEYLHDDMGHMCP